MYPLQERANILREAFQKHEKEEKSGQKQRNILEKEELRQTFSTDFPELYHLLIASDVVIEGDYNLNGQKIVLTYEDKQISIIHEGKKGEMNKWCFQGKEFFGQMKESEQRLIVALADAFAQAQSKAKI